MQSIRAVELAKKLGMSRYTMQDICQRDKKLAFKRNGVYYIRISELAKRPGYDLVRALMVTSSRCIKATTLAKISGISRRTVVGWCLSRPNFACRIGKTWYVDLDGLNASEEQIDAIIKSGLSNIAPDQSEDES